MLNIENWHVYIYVARASRTLERLNCTSIGPELGFRLARNGDGRAVLQ